MKTICLSAFHRLVVDLKLSTQDMVLARPLIILNFHFNICFSGSVDGYVIK